MTGPVDAPVAVPNAVVEAVAGARRVVALTGAGMSAESGVPTFRDPDNGLWSRYRPEQLATPEAWDREPELVWAWYAWRLHLAAGVEPNAGHRALAQLATIREVRIVTQNVDDLHERAGSEAVVHLHGRIDALRCSRCGAAHADPIELPEEQQTQLAPPVCRKCRGRVRPGVVWFGEDLPMDAFLEAGRAVDRADAVLVVGTSGVVYPAASLPYRAAQRGIPVIEINPEATEFTSDARLSWRETAARALPALCRIMCGETDLSSPQPRMRP